MADYEDPQKPKDEHISIGDQPTDVEEIRFGKGPGEGEMTPLPDLGGHPRGLWVLFITEMWERFSYYGMRGLLALFLAASTAAMINGEANENPGFGWTEAEASLLYGVYTFMVYLTSIFGGIVADRLLGTNRSMLVGGWIIAAGHIMLAFSSFFSYQPGLPVSPENAPGAFYSFLSGLALIIIGTGFFKPCVSVMVGQLYSEGDERRDSGFTLFYMGINLGSLLSYLIAGTLGEAVGWHWGFGSAAVGMILGLFTYMFLRPKYLQGVGIPPEPSKSRKNKGLVVGSLALLLAVPLLPLGLSFFNGLQPIMDTWSNLTENVPAVAIGGVVAVVLLISIGIFLSMQPPETRSRLAVIFVLAILGNLGFWTAFEQAGTSLNFFALNSTDRTAFGLFGPDGATGLLDNGFPATWFQTFNPLAILLFAPFFSWLWIWLNRRRLNPSTPMKFAIGLWLLGLAFIAMVFGAMEARDEGVAGPHWLLITYVVYTWGELCLSPVGLSMVTKLAPKRLQSVMMGLWFFSLALSNLLAGLIAAWSRKFLPGQDGSAAEATFMIDGLPGFFLLLVVVPLGIGALIALLTPLLRKMMKGIH